MSNAVLASDPVVNAFLEAFGLSDHSGTIRSFTIHAEAGSLLTLNVEMIITHEHFAEVTRVIDEYQLHVPTPRPSLKKPPPEGARVFDALK